MKHNLKTLRRLDSLMLRLGVYDWVTDDGRLALAVRKYLGEKPTIKKTEKVIAHLERVIQDASITAETNISRWID